MKKQLLFPNSLSLTFKIGVLVLLLFSIKTNAQTITSVSPNQGQLGQTLDVFISGQNVDFLNGSMSIQTNFNQGTTSIFAPPVSVNPAGDVLRVSLDLNNTYPTGTYDLSVNTPAHGLLTLSNAFQIDPVALRRAIPDNAIIGQVYMVLVTGDNIDFTTVTVPPRYIGGPNIIPTSIVGTRGTDTLELSVNLSSTSLLEGNYNLEVVIPGNTLTLRNALDLTTTNISGKVYYDLNSNVTQDAGELGFKNIQLELLPGGAIATTDGNGNYKFSRLATGTYQVVATAPDSTFITNPSDTQTVVINTGAGYTASYGINSNSPSVVNNPTVNIISGRARCNVDVVYTTTVRNEGFTPTSGILKVEKNSNITYRAATISLADSVNGDTIYYSYSGLLPGEQFQRRIVCDVPGVNVLAVGASITAVAEINSIDGSGNIIAGTSKTNNAVTTVRCSYDPNDKQVTPAGVRSEGYVVHDTRLEYKIRFQNTGNDTAFRVVVLDTLNANLDLSTFEFIGASHPVVTTINANRELSFTFNNILLVDSTTNEPESNGFIVFKISPNANLADSTQVTNRAGIYFDFNPPIITNDVINTYVTNLPVSLKEFETASFKASIYPNPNNGIFTIETTESLTDAFLTVYDLQGKIVYSETQVNGKTLNVNLEDEPKGVYFISLVNKGEILNKKLIVY